MQLRWKRFCDFYVPYLGKLCISSTKNNAENVAVSYGHSTSLYNEMKNGVDKLMLITGLIPR